MKQLESRTGEKLGRKFDDQLAEQALENMEINFSGGGSMGDGESGDPSTGSEYPSEDG